VTPPRWDELDAILDEALDLPTSERAAFLARQGLEPSERVRLERLLSIAEAPDATLTGGGGLAGVLGDDLVAFLEQEPSSSDDVPGHRLGRRIGSGGMGEVWEAEQLAPVRRRVAVKVLRPGLATERVVSRFESERQALALMSHPGIAQIFDAGLTGSGRPFFTMELVDGPPFTAFCDAQCLSIRDRLRLFVDVCDAVLHAHQKGVVHRDIKPSNVLVTRVDGRPVPKVIDFGIARLVDGPLEAATVLTEAGMVVGTPEYMSPEQAGASPADVDTRADVYALGVVLYELVAGVRPFERRDASVASLGDLFRDIRETEPERPSRRVEGTGERSFAVAAARDTEPWALVRSLRGDLDWITMKALEKDRERRYGSVDELSADVRRHLMDEPVTVGPPGAGYRLGKFARRNSGLLTATAAVVVAVVAGLLGTVTGLVRAREEAARARTQAAIAEAVNAFLNQDLLAAVAPGSQGRDVTMREALDAAASRLEGRFQGQPEVEASVRHTIGETYMRLGRLDDASPHLERAVALRERALGADAPETLVTVHALGELRFYQGRVDEAEALLRRSFEGRERALGPNDALTLAAMSDLGAVAQDRGRLDEAERLYRGAYERASVVLAGDDPSLLSMMHNLGALLQDRGRLDEAETWLRRAYEGSRTRLGPDHPDTLSSLSLLGSVLREAERLAEAEPIYRETLAARTRVLGEKHPSTLLSANNLAMLYYDLGRLEEAEALQRATLETQRRVLGRDHDATILSLGNLGAILTRLGRAREAAPLLADAVERCRRVLGTGHSLCGHTLRKQGNCLVALGRYPEAERRLLEAHAVLAAAYADDHPSTRLAAADAARLYEAWGRPGEVAAWRARAESPGTAPSP
jgi:tetratricopeptide (TPR) repeat protein